MKISINFLKAIGHTDRVYIRCIASKNTPLPELEARGMTYTDKSGRVKKSTVNGYIDLATYQRRWLQYSNCDDQSLSDPAQLMRLPGFDHLTWNPETQDFDRLKCELLELNEVCYSLEQFDRILPALDIDRWCKQSLEIVESDADDRDMRTLAQYLPGFDSSGSWIKAKCPAHDGESADSLHIDSLIYRIARLGKPNRFDSLLNLVKSVATATLFTSSDVGFWRR